MVFRKMVRVMGFNGSSHVGCMILPDDESRSSFPNRQVFLIFKML
jgi:hypothetical protein